MTPRQRKTEFIRGVKAALREVKKRLPLKRPSSINGLAEVAGLSSSDVYETAVEEAQQELTSRLNRLLAIARKP